MMLAFHNKPEIKDEYLTRVKAHYEADRIIHGKYWENGKGCAVGCTIQGYDHSKYETELGIPASIAYLEDAIFEGLTNGESMKFPLQFLEAIKVGADLSLVIAKFMVWLLVDPKYGVYQYASEDGKKAIVTVADLYKRVIRRGQVSDDEWIRARDAARAARAAGAARAAARAAGAAWEARDAARAAWEAGDAAWAARYATGDAAYKRMKKKLLSLLRSAKLGK